MSDARVASMTLRFASLLLCALLGGGCATTSGSLAALRGRPLLVVDDAGAGAADREGRLNRALALLPVRIWPSEAEPALLERLDEAPARVAAGRTAAETRRIPWLLVRDAAGARVETARGGRVLWEATLRGKAAPEAQVRDQLQRALVARGASAGPLDPRETRLAPLPALDAIRSLAVAGRWEDHGAALDRALSEWPADPALRVHEGLAASLAGGGSAGLDQARGMNPEGESELFALALAAKAGGNLALALAARRQLARLFPERLDYLPEYADLVAETGGDEQALAAIAIARGAGPPAGLDRLSSMSAPHDAPDALPWADLAFTHGWYLARLKRWEQAALSYEDAAALYERMDRLVELGDTLNNAGVAMVEAGSPLVAARTFGRALLVRAGGDPVKAANSRYNQGRAYSEAGKTAQALRTWRTAAREYHVAGDDWEAVDTRIDTLELYVREGDGEGMEAEARELLRAAADAEGPPERLAEAEANTWFELGKGRLTFGDPDGSLEAYRRSLAGWRQLGRPLEQGQTLYSMALPHLAKFEFEAAFDDLVAALEIAGELNDSASIVAIRQQLLEIQDLVRKSGREPPAVPEALQRWFD